MTGKFIAILFSLMILAQAYTVRRLVGTWLFPACMFGLFWFFMSFAPLVVMWSVPIDPFGMGFIFLCLIFFSTSAVFFPWRKAFQGALPRKNEVQDVNTKFLKRSLWFTSAAALACVVLNSRAQGITLSQMILDSVVSAASYREMATYGHLNVTIWLRLGEILCFAVAPLGGLLIASTKSKWTRFCILIASFAPATFMALAQSVKGTLFCCIAFFYGGILICRIRQNDFRLIKKGSLKKLTLYGVVLFAITAISFLSRGFQNSTDRDFIKQGLEARFASYAFGHLYGFSDWCAFELGRKSQIHYDEEPIAYGFYTFSPAFRTLGSTRTAPVGMYDDYYEYESEFVTNIYTAFRGFLQDFGVVGSLIFMFAIGVGFHAVFYLVLMQRYPSLSSISFIFSVGFIYASYIRSLFDWSGLYFTFVFLLALLWWNQHRSFLRGLLRSAMPSRSNERPSTAGAII